jgi:toxin ParE1/3/4
VNPDLFAPAARRELRAALRWIARDNEPAAEALLQAALHGARRIAARPLLGRLRTELLPAPYRFWRVAGFPYLLVYNAARQPPRVVRFVHMARDLGPLLADLADVPDADEAN